MRTPFPLYAKIVIWFFLNLLVVVLVAAVLLRARFGNTTEWLLASDARDRIQSMTQVLAAELDHTPSMFHDEILERYSAAYHLVLAVYSNEGNHLVGKKLDLPANVLEALRKEKGPPGQEDGPPDVHPPRNDRPPPPPRPEDLFGGPLDSLFSPPPREDSSEDRPSELAAQQQSPPRRRRPPAPLPAAFPLELVRSEKPAALWLMVRAPMIAEARGTRQRMTLVGRIDSLTDNALLFDIRPWIWWGAALLLFSALFWLPLVRGLTRAISKLTRATEQIADGNFDLQLNDQRRDELGRLSHAINVMSGRLAGFVSGQKRFLGDIAHELCSPLARMEMGLGVMEQRMPPDQQERLGDVQDDVREMRELVNELLSFSKAGLRTPDAPITVINLHSLVAEAVEREGNGNVVVDVDPLLEIVGDARLLLRAVVNLARNAIRYAGQAGPIKVSAHKRGDFLYITVSDSGPGVPEDALPRLFDAFYRPDEARSRETGGFGLGLAIVKSCVEACGGTVTAANRPEGGFEVEMKFEAV